MTPAPAPRPGCPSPSAWALSPPSAPSLLPPSPALQPSLRRRLCLNFRGRSRRRREAGRGTGGGTGQGHPSSLQPGPSNLLPTLAAWEGCGDLKPTAAAGSTSSSGSSRYPRPREPSPAPLPGTPARVPFPGLLPGTSSRGSLSSLALAAAAPPSFAPSSRTAGASRRRQLRWSIPRRGTAGARGRWPPGRGEGSLRARPGEAGSTPGITGCSLPGRFPAWTPGFSGSLPGLQGLAAGSGCGRKGRKRRAEGDGNDRGGPFGWVCPFTHHSHDSAVSSQQFRVIIKWEWASGWVWGRIWGWERSRSLGRRTDPGGSVLPSDEPQAVGCCTELSPLQGAGPL